MTEEEEEIDTDDYDDRCCGDYTGMTLEGRDICECSCHKITEPESE